MTAPVYLAPPEAVALHGAETLTDLEVSIEWLSLMRAVKVSRNVHDRIQDFRSLAAVCLVIARRMQAEEEGR